VSTDSIQSRSKVRSVYTFSEQIAGQAAARAHGIGACYNYPEDDHCDGGITTQLVRTVDCSRAALTAMLWVEDAGVFEYRRIRHGVDLGADTLCRCQHSESDQPCYEQLAEALRHVVKTALEGTGSDVPDLVGSMVLWMSKLPTGASEISYSKCCGSRLCRYL
jgi:hypothetical protein